MGSPGSLSMPTVLCQIPEVVEINELLALGLGPSDIVEAVLPPLSPEMRILLRQYLKQLEQSSNVLTELMVFDDMELVLITEIPVETMTLVSGNA